MCTFAVLIHAVALDSRGISSSTRPTYLVAFSGECSSTLSGVLILDCSTRPFPVHVQQPKLSSDVSETDEDLVWQDHLDEHHLPRLLIDTGRKEAEAEAD